MTTDQLQQTFFQHIKTLLPPHVSMVDEIADLLNISNDSAYRRIRGEKPITLDEVAILSNHFKISIDQLLNLKSDAFLFTGQTTDMPGFTYDKWLLSIAEHLQFFLSFPQKHIYYLAKEIPFYYYFLIPEIAAFKSFFFMRSILQYEELKNAKFSVYDDFSRFYEIFQKNSHLFSELPSTEIWNVENITSTLHQIEVYKATGAFKSPDDAQVLLDKFYLLIDHLEKQAESGVKLRYGQDPSGSSVPYRMFVNELIMGDNVHLIQLGPKYMAAVNHGVINYMVTSDERFTSFTKKTLDTIIQKSTLISGVNEKDRLMFFNQLRAKIVHSKKIISVYGS